MRAKQGKSLKVICRFGILEFREFNGWRYVKSYFVSCFHIRNMFRMMYMFLHLVLERGLHLCLDFLQVHKNLQYMTSFFQNFGYLGFGFFIVLEAINHIYI